MSGFLNLQKLKPEHLKTKIKKNLRPIVDKKKSGGCTSCNKG